MSITGYTKARVDELLATISTALGNKVNSSTYVAGLNGKADLVSGAVPDAQLPTRLGDTALKAALVPFWAPNEVVAQDAVRMTALGVTIKRTAAGTTRASYDATESALWTVTGGSGTLPTKRVTMPISSDGQAGNSAGPHDIAQRSIITLPVTTTRWRVRVANLVPKTGALLSGSIPVTAGYIGAPSIASDGTWGGAFTATPAKAWDAFTTPADASEYISPWITDSALQFAADTPTALSWGFTTASAAVSVSKGGQTIANAYYGTGDSTRVGTAAAPSSTFAQNATFLDVRVEYEAVASLPVVLVIGDSTAAGAIDDGSLYPALIGPSATWPGQMSLLHRCLVVNAGVSGLGYGDFRADTAVMTLKRFDLLTTPPDIVVMASGINEVAANLTLSSFMGFLTTCKQRVTAYTGAKRFIVCTVMPQPRWAAASASDNLRISYNQAIRRGVSGIPAVIDHDDMLAGKTATFFGSGTIHPGTGAYALLAARTAIR